MVQFEPKSGSHIFLEKMPERKTWSIDEELPAMSGHRDVIVSVCNDKFVQGLRVLMDSVRRHGRIANAEWRVIYGAGFCPLSAESRRAIRNTWNTVEFQPVEEKAAFDVNIAHPPHRPALLKLEMLGIRGFRRLLYLDVDTLCTGSLDMLFTLKSSVAMSRSRNVESGYFNTGVISIDGSLLGGDMLARAIDRVADSDGYMLDQPLLNTMFRDEELDVEELPDIYNYQMIAGHPSIPLEDDLIARRNEIRLLHWCGHAGKRLKPWDLRENPLFSSYLWRVAARNALQDADADAARAVADAA